MKPSFDKLLKNYEKKDFVLQQKAKVILSISLSMLILLLIVMFCAIFLFEETLHILLLPQLFAFIVILCAIGLLVKGHFSIAANLILIICLTVTWIILFLDPTGPITRLDTIAFVLGLLTMTSLIMNKAQWPVIVYFLVNFVLLVVFVIFVGNQLDFTNIDSFDYLQDNAIAMLFICIISYKGFSINRKALDKAAKEIEERKTAEHASASAKAFLESSLSSIPEGILLLDETICLSYVNPVFLNWSGISREGLLGKPIDTVASMFLEPKSAQQVSEGAVGRIRNGESIIGDELEFLDVNGKYKPVAFTAAPILSEAGEIIGGVVILVDLTDRRQLETKLRQSQKMEAIGTLAGGIAHDFNNILSAIMGNTELLKYQKNIAEPAKKKLDNIYAASERAKDLVSQILLFSRKSEQECRPVALRLIVKETLKLLKASLPSTIEIRLKMTEESIQVLADPTQIHQILMNLCTNAHYAMLYSGGMLELELSSVDVVAGDLQKVAGLKPGHWAKLCVKDSGDGMTPQMVERIFEPYFSTREKGVGTGLGLAVVHGIVQSYGGIIDVYSQPGEGTMFTVFLPRVDQLIEETFQPVGPIPLGNNERILFVDDEVMVTDFAIDALEGLKYQVVAASSAAEALKNFSSSPDDFDLVITDMTMPKMTGDVLAKEILKIRPDIPVILCTGFSETITKEKALAAGIKDFLMKPVKIQDLAESVQKVLAG